MDLQSAYRLMEKPHKIPGNYSPLFFLLRTYTMRSKKYTIDTLLRKQIFQHKKKMWVLLNQRFKINISKKECFKIPAFGSTLSLSSKILPTPIHPLRKIVCGRDFTCLE